MAQLTTFCRRQVLNVIGEGMYGCPTNQRAGISGGGRGTTFITFKQAGLFNFLM